MSELPSGTCRQVAGCLVVCRLVLSTPMTVLLSHFKLGYLGLTAAWLCQLFFKDGGLLCLWLQCGWPLAQGLFPSVWGHTMMCTVQLPVIQGAAISQLQGLPVMVQTTSYTMGWRTPVRLRDQAMCMGG